MLQSNLAEAGGEPASRLVYKSKKQVLSLGLIVLMMVQFIDESWVPHDKFPGWYQSADSSERFVFFDFDSGDSSIKQGNYLYWRGATVAAGRYTLGRVHKHHSSLLLLRHNFDTTFTNPSFFEAYQTDSTIEIRGHVGWTSHVVKVRSWGPARRGQYVE